jgi:hypothetical protein
MKRLILLLLLIPSLCFAKDKIKPEYCDWDGKVKTEYMLDNVITGAALGLVTTFIVSVVKPTVMVGSFAGFSVIAGIAGISLARASECNNWYETAMKGKS